MIHYNPINRSETKSDEEWSMVLWLQEATAHRLVESWQYEPKSFELFPAVKYQEPKQLKTKIKMVERSLCQNAVYTPDFLITFTHKGKALLASVFKESFLISGGETIYIDIKGAFNPNDQPRYFSIIQKAVYHLHSVWVPRVVPFHKVKGKAKGLFPVTFAPESLRWMKNGKGLNSMGRSCLNITEFIQANTDLFNQELALDNAGK